MNVDWDIIYRNSKSIESFERRGTEYSRVRMKFRFYFDVTFVPPGKSSRNRFKVIHIILLRFLMSTMV